MMLRSWPSGKNFLRSFISSYRLQSKFSKTMCRVSFSRITSLSFTVGNHGLVTAVIRSLKLANAADDNAGPAPAKQCFTYVRVAELSQ